VHTGERAKENRKKVFCVESEKNIDPRGGKIFLLYRTRRPPTKIFYTHTRALSLFLFWLLHVHTLLLLVMSETFLSSSRSIFSFFRRTMGKFTLYSFAVNSNRTSLMFQ
jgi:hypothetical protein